MNSINTQSKPMIGSKTSWGRIFVAWMLLIGLATLVKGCDNDNDHPLFIFKEAVTWN